MSDRDIRPTATKAPFQMEETGDVATGESVGPRLLDSVEFYVHDGGGYGWHLDREQPAEATALLVVGNLGPVGVFEEPVGLILETELTQTMARVVVGNGATVTARPHIRIQVVHQVLGQLTNPCGDPFGLFGAIRTMKQCGVVMDDHRRTRPGGDDDWALGLVEDIQGLGRHATGVVVQPDVERWLSATSLLGREFDGATGLLQGGDRRTSYLRCQGVDETGDK